MTIERRSGRAWPIGPALLAVALAFAPGAPAATSSFVIRGARVFDGVRVLPPADVWVEAGTIRAIGPGLKVPPGTEEIEFAKR